MSELIIKGQKAKEASYVLMNATTTEKNNALLKMAEVLLKNSKEILEANKKDLENAIEKGTPKAMLDRLALDENRINGMADGLKDVVSLPDPIGEVTGMWKRPNGLQIGKQRVPLGVIGIIYEARPNVTCDAAGLCLKSGNVVILRGGKEAINSNVAIVKALREGVKEAGLPEDVIQLVENTDREVATEMMKLNQYIDVLIPRGGAGLIQSVVQNATVPVIETGTGNCHVYVDCDADLEMAKNIVINAKTSRPSVCNAEEKLLVNEKIAKEFLPIIYKALKEKDVEVRGDKKVLEVLNEATEIQDDEWGKEYLDYIIGVKIVKDVDEAINHINKYGTGHSEAIIT
ncbi:MAG: glutamate-5-semialdehyde dehydrogenase, partial [Clostridium sp.]|nr:glutamate-5-semialdehyde dehydrogenase [Clostridium sp.]